MLVGGAGGTLWTTSRFARIGVNLTFDGPNVASSVTARVANMTLYKPYAYGDELHG